MIIARGRGLVNGVDKSLAGAWDGGGFLWILFHGEKTQGKGKPREKGAEIEKERDDMMQCLIFGLITQYYGKRINFINRIY